MVNKLSKLRALAFISVAMLALLAFVALRWR